MTTSQFKTLVKSMRANQEQIDKLQGANLKLQKEVRSGYKDTFLDVRRSLGMSTEEIAKATGRLYSNLYYPSVEICIMLLDMLEGKPVKKHTIKARGKKR